MGQPILMILLSDDGPAVPAQTVNDRTQPPDAITIASFNRRQHLAPDQSVANGVGLTAGFRGHSAATSWPGGSLTLPVAVASCDL